MQLLYIYLLKIHRKCQNCNRKYDRHSHQTQEIVTHPDISFKPKGECFIRQKSKLVSQGKFEIWYSCVHFPDYCFCCCCIFILSQMYHSTTYQHTCNIYKYKTMLQLYCNIIECHLPVVFNPCVTHSIHFISLNQCFSTPVLGTHLPEGFCCKQELTHLISWLNQSNHQKCPWLVKPGVWVLGYNKNLLASGSRGLELRNTALNCTFDYSYIASPGFFNNNIFVCKIWNVFHILKLADRELATKY